MARLGGANELVVGHAELGPRFPKALAGAVGLLQGRQTVGLRRPLNFEAVLVGAGQVEDLFAQKPVPAGDRITVEHRVGVADVGRVVDVEDRGRQEIARHRLRLPAHTSDVDLHITPVPHFNAKRHKRGTSDPKVPVLLRQQPLPLSTV